MDNKFERKIIKELESIKVDTWNQLEEIKKLLEKIARGAGK